MLTAEEVKPLLVHEDHRVRQAAVEYFRGAWPEDVQVLPLVLQAFRQYGGDSGRLGLAACSHFALDERSLDEVLRTLASSQDEIAAIYLNRVIAAAPINLQVSREEVIVSSPNLFPETIATIRRRKDVAQWSADALWTELRDFAERSEDAEYVHEFDHPYADALVAALKQHDQPDAESLCEHLASIGEENGWLEICLINLVGERRLRQAVPTLVDKYRIDADYMRARVTDALGKIGDAEAVRLIRAAFPGESWAFKNFSSTVLGDIKHQESEDALLALLETEREAEIRTMLCLELCKLFSSRGVEAVVDVIRSGYACSIECLEDTVLPVAKVLGIEIPEADEWQTASEERDEQGAKRAAELEELLRRYKAAMAPHREPAADSGTRTATKVKAPATTVKSPATIRAESPKVGRNDLCPCGSGRKFKKCCARKPR